MITVLPELVLEAVLGIVMAVSSLSLLVDSLSRCHCLLSHHHCQPLLKPLPPQFPGTHICAQLFKTGLVSILNSVLQPSDEDS